MSLDERYTYWYLPIMLNAKKKKYNQLNYVNIVHSQTFD